jgi:rod shape-determining protein MreD
MAAGRPSRGPGAGPGTEVRRKLIAAVALGAALLIQLTIVNGLVLPGGGTPDLVLLCVISLALLGGQRAGLIAGFCAGLALDLAPPASQPVGVYALVLCLAGYCCGRMRFTLRRSVLLALAVAATAAAAGEALVTGLTLALDSPDVTWAVAVEMLRSSMLYDITLSPLALFVVVRVAIAVGVSVSEPVSPCALEPGGSAGPAGQAGTAGAGLGRGAGLDSAGRVGLDVRGSLRPAGDMASAGSVGWLTRPGRSRHARRAHARRIALLTGAMQRAGDVWVGSRPAGLRPCDPVPVARPPAPARLRPAAGMPGSAATVSRPGPVIMPARRVWLGLADEQRRQRRARPKGEAGHGTGRPAADQHGVDRHGLFGSGVPRIAFGGDLMPRSSGRSAAGGFAVGAASQPGLQSGRRRHGASRIAFGGSGPAPTGRVSPGRHGASRIAFGGSGRARTGRVSPGRHGASRIAFGGSDPMRTGRTSAGRPAAPRFRSTSSRSAAGSWLAGSRSALPRHPAVRSRQPKIARFGFSRRPMLALPGWRRTGGRATVWRIGSSRIGGSHQ